MKRVLLLLLVAACGPLEPQREKEATTVQQETELRMTSSGRIIYENIYIEDADGQKKEIRAYAYDTLLKIYCEWEPCKESANNLEVDCNTYRNSGKDYKEGQMFRCLPLYLDNIARNEEILDQKDWHRDMYQKLSPKLVDGNTVFISYADPSCINHLFILPLNSFENAADATREKYRTDPHTKLVVPIIEHTGNVYSRLNNDSSQSSPCIKIDIDEEWRKTLAMTYEGELVDPKIFARAEIKKQQ